MSALGNIAKGGALTLIAVLTGCSPRPGTDGHPPASAAEVAAYDQARPILERNCLMCHSHKPLVTTLRAPPAGVVLETPEQLRRFAPRVVATTSTTQVMPPANLTAMTEADRKALTEILRSQWVKDN